MVLLLAWLLKGNISVLLRFTNHRSGELSSKNHSTKYYKEKSCDMVPQKTIMMV